MSSPDGYLLSPSTAQKVSDLVSRTGSLSPGYSGGASQAALCWVNVTTEAEYAEGTVQQFDPIALTWINYGDVWVRSDKDSSTVPAGRWLCRMTGNYDGGTEDTPDVRPLAIAKVSSASDSGGDGGDGSSGCGWTAGLIEDDCLKASSAGTDDIYLKSTDGSTWTGGTLTICSIAYTVSFSRGDCSGPCVTLTAGETTLTGVRASCGCGSASFSFPKRTLCPSSERDEGGPCFDTVGVSIAWNACPIDGWGGSGYYCTITSGQDCTTDGVTRHLTDPLDHTYTICSGPYDSAEDTICADNDTSDTTCCSSRGDSMPTAIYATFGGVLSWIGTVEFDIGALVGGHQPRVYNPTGDWASTNSVCGGFVGMGSLSCNSETGLWSFGAGFALSGSMTWTTSSVAATSCDPFTISFTGAVTRSGGEGFPTGTCAEGTGTVTFTETSP